MRKIIKFLVVFLLILTLAISNVTAISTQKDDIKVSKEGINYIDMSPEELIRNFDPKCKEMSEEEIHEYIKSIRIESPPLRQINEEDLQNLKGPSTTSLGTLTYEAPWEVFDFEYKEEKWGIADAGCEGTTDSYQGWTNIAAAGGPGAGESSMTVWITHGIYFHAPVTDTYTIKFDHTIQGWVNGAITWIDAVSSSEVAMFFRVGSKEVRKDILYEQTIPIVYQQYTKYFDKRKTPTITAELYEGNYYSIEAIAAIKCRALGVLMDFAYAYGHLDDEEASGWKNGAVLNEITISWPNHSPNKPYSPSPSNGATNLGIDTDLSWKCSDPDGDALKYDIYFGTSSSPPKKKSGHTSKSYNPGELDYETKYYWKIVAKDGNGGSATSSIWSFTTKKEPKDTCCFAPGTKITMADGSYKCIEDIKIGDKILSYDLEKNTESIWTVRMLGSPMGDLYEINNGLLSLTGEHPIYIKKQNGKTGWGAIKVNPKAVRLKEEIITIEVGDKLKTKEGEWIEITSISHDSKFVKTYNILSFVGTKTYFANSILVYEEHPPFPVIPIQYLTWLINKIPFLGRIFNNINAIMAFIN
jgi:hypothetical protein